MSHILQLSPCDDILWLIGKSVVERRKVLKQIAREQQATLNYWIYRSSDKWVREYLKSQYNDLTPFQVSKGKTLLNWDQCKVMRETARLKKYGINFEIHKYGINKYGYEIVRGQKKVL